MESRKKTIITVSQRVKLDDPISLRKTLKKLCHDHGLKGTLVLSVEGVYGLLAGDREGIEALLGEIRTLPGVLPISYQEETVETAPFERLFVKIKKDFRPEPLFHYWKQPVSGLRVRKPNQIVAGEKPEHLFDTMKCHRPAT